MNLYAYCAGNPVNRIDPDGLFPGYGNPRANQGRTDDLLTLLNFANIDGTNVGNQVRSFLENTGYEVLYGERSMGSPAGYINRTKKQIFIPTSANDGDAAKTLFHEYLHYATVARASFVPESFRGEFERGSEAFFRQHAWIWGESAKLHTAMARTVGETGVGLNAGEFKKISDQYQNNTFDDFVRYIKSRGMDLY